jgi:hypothetical protein
VDEPDDLLNSLHPASDGGRRAALFPFGSRSRSRGHEFQEILGIGHLNPRLVLSVRNCIAKPEYFLESLKRRSLPIQNDSSDFGYQLQLLVRAETLL